MSVWDDSWMVPTKRATEAVSPDHGGTITSQENSAAPRRWRAMWGAADHLIGRWLGMSPAYAEQQCDRRDHSVTFRSLDDGPLFWMTTVIDEEIERAGAPIEYAAVITDRILHRLVTGAAE